MPQVFVTRRETFSSAHRLRSSSLSQEQNQDIFGKCNNQHGHGHNYVIEVTVAGHPDKTTGMVVNIADLKIWIKEKVLDVLDHRNIHKEVEYFMNGVVSTTENVAVFCWYQLVGIIKLRFGRLRRILSPKGGSSRDIWFKNSTRMVDMF